MTIQLNFSEFKQCKMVFFQLYLIGFVVCYFGCACFNLSELERLSGLVGRPSESHPLHNSGLLSLDPVQDKTPLYSQLLQAYKWSNKVYSSSHTYSHW